MQNPNNSILPESPSITIRGEQFPIRLTAGSLIRLNQQHGVNVLDQGPPDPHALDHNVASQAYREALESGASPEELAPLEAQLTEVWGKLSEERRAWRHPLDVREPLARLELACKIAAEAINSGGSKRKPALTAVEIADMIDMHEIPAMIQGVFDAVGKLLAARNAPSEPASIGDTAVRP